MKVCAEVIPSWRRFTHLTSLPANASSTFQAESHQFTFCRKGFKMIKQHESSQHPLISVCWKNHICIFPTDCCCQIEIQALKIESCWVLITFFFLDLNFWRLKVLSKTHSDFSNENRTLRWHLVKQMGRADSSAAYQIHHLSFQPRKWKNSSCAQVCFCLSFGDPSTCPCFYL